MTIKRLILGLLTAIVLFVVGLSLLDSWRQPQIQSRLELYQINLLLHTSEWQSENGDDSGVKSAREALIGSEPLKAAEKQYRDFLSTSQNNLEKAQAQLTLLSSRASAGPLSEENTELYLSNEKQKLQESKVELQSFINELNLKIGILEAKQGKLENALKTWQALKSNKQKSAVNTANVLIGLWSKPPRILPDARQPIQTSLDGWFRYQALSKLYTLQQRQEALEKLELKEQKIAENAVLRLAIVGALPILAILIGVGLLIFLIAQRLLKKERSLLAQNANVTWSTPWDAETIWQVFVVGFFGVQLFVSIFFIPILFEILRIEPSSFDVKTQAFSVLTDYSIIASGAVLVVYLSIKSFLPLPEGWFNLKISKSAIFWGIGGYLVALPLVIIVSLINQQIWKGQGGSNPLLSLALESKDGVAIAIFFVTAAVAAPLFEEFLFRGFLLPSLTRYMPVWGAIVVSSLLFAIAHLSLSEILPLTTLGIVLGIVYTRSRNLAAPMLLHALWNSGTLLSLFILGSASS